MQIQMLATAAGPQGVYLAGNTYDVPENLGRAWVAAGAAVSREAPKPVTAPEPAPSTKGKRGPHVRTATAIPPAESADVTPQNRGA